MSLINQMLQELDARRSEVTGTDLYGQQIRAVSERRRIHPAWWIALALAILLSGVLAWVLSHPPVDAMERSGTQLPLKLDVDLNMTAAGAADSLNDVSASSVAAHPDVPPVRNMAVAPVVPEKPTLEAVGERTPPVKQSSPARVVKEVPATPVPELARVVPAAASLPPAIAAAAPATLNKQVKELTPQQRAENEYRKALLALQQGKSAEAIDDLEQVLQLDAQHATARQALIGVLLGNQRQDDALRRVREGLKLDPAQSGWAMILARLQLEKGELQPAIETLERTLPHAADRADYRAFLAALLQRDGRHKQATEHYLLALQKAPQTGVWWMGLGISLQADNRNPEAQEAFKHAKATNTLSSDLLAFVDARLNQLQR